jgi:hypothetical protein
VHQGGHLQRAAAVEADVLAQAGVDGADRLRQRVQVGDDLSGTELARKPAVPVGTLRNWQANPAGNLCLAPVRGHRYKES